MEAASRPPLEQLSDLPVEEPADAAAQRPPASPASAAPAVNGSPASKDPAQTGITFLDPAALVLEPGSTVPEPAPSVAATAAVVSAAEELQLLEDPAVVEELLTAPPPPPPKTIPAAAPAPVPAATAATATAAARTEARVPIIKTASLSAAATKAAATKLAAASKRSGEPPAPKPAAPVIPSVRPASAKPAAPSSASSGTSEGLAGWTSARAAAAPAAKPKATPASASAPAAPSATAAVSKGPSSVSKATAGTAASASATASTAPVPMDRDFIARNQVVERYLSGRLPLKGATEFEQFVNRHPELLDEIGLPERVNAGLRLLEASGKPEPWQEAPRPAWQKPQVTIALAAVAGVLAVALMVVSGTGAAKSHKISALQKQVTDQPLDPATSTREIRVLPSREGASNSPAISIGAGGAQLADFKIDESRSPYHIFRVTIDRLDQGRVGVITNLVKDSNGHLRIALNSTALGPGNYQLTIEGLNWRGDPEPDSWVTIGIQR
jgi:hypothetical protein